jgi:ABC-type glycerol-3-phosphate transport system substrate-binding protein
MYALAAPRNLFIKRAIAILAILAVAAALAAALASATSADQTVVHSHIAKSGQVVVSGYDGGAPLLPKSTP